MTDLNERVVQEWKDSTTGRERVKEVLTETTEPATASEIATRAFVSEPTARKYLEELVEEDIGETTQAGRTVHFKRNKGRFVDRRIEELRTNHSLQELIDGIRDMKEELATLREKYGVESPEDLAIDLDPGDEGWGDIGRWRATRQNLALTKAALQVDEAHRLAEA